MSFIHALVLGIIQGVAEFLPISSSGHLILLPHFFSWPDQGLTVDAILHLATVLAVVIAFCGDIKKMRAAFSGNLEKIKNNILIFIIAVAPAGIIGFFLNDWLEKNLRSTYIVAFSLIFWGIILWLAENYYQKSAHNKTSVLADISWRQSFAVGLLQIVALIPGTSRSGVTITGGLFSDLDKTLAVKFSFLVGLPLSLAAGVFGLIRLINADLTCGQIAPLTISFVSALVSGVLSIKLLLWLSQKSTFRILVVYRIILGIIIFIFF